MKENVIPSDHSGCLVCLDVHGNRIEYKVNSVQRNDNDEIEVVLTGKGGTFPAWILEYELEWFVAYEDSYADETYPPVDQYVTQLVVNQVDVWQLNEIL